MPLDATAQKHWLSATQHDTYQLCPRKWGWEKLDGIKKPRNKYADRGDAIHGLLENWLERGTPIDTSTDYGKMVVPGLKYLPPPGAGLVEKRFKFQTETAIYVGKWDLLQQFQRELHLTRIIDHKTTGNFKWVKPAHILKSNVQAILYAVAGIVCEPVPEDRDKLFLELSWIYYLTSATNPGARKVTVYVVPDGKSLREMDGYLPGSFNPSSGLMDLTFHSDVMEEFARIETVSREMLDHHRMGRKAIDLEYRVAGCEAFGGCPYLDTHCKLTPQEKIRGYMEQQSAADKMRAARQQQEERAAAETPSATPSPATGGGEEVTMAAKMRAAKSATTEASPDVVEGAAAATAETAAEVQSKPPAVNPPGEADAKPSEKPMDPAMAAEARKVIDGAGTKVSGRLRMAGNIASGIIGARLFVHSAPDYAKSVGDLALKITDAIIAAAKK